ncbi:MAG: hypothetical protein ACI8PZ_006742, partial [Myxococcota bacterium]
DPAAAELADGSARGQDGRDAPTSGLKLPVLLEEADVQQLQLDTRACGAAVPTAREFAQSAFFHLDAPFVPPGATHAMSRGVLLVGGRDVATGTTLGDVWLLDLTNAPTHLLGAGPDPDVPVECPWHQMSDHGASGLVGGREGGALAFSPSIDDTGFLAGFVLMGGWAADGDTASATDDVSVLPLDNLSGGFGPTGAALPLVPYTFVERGDPACTIPVANFVCTPYDVDDDGAVTHHCDESYPFSVNPCTGEFVDGSCDYVSDVIGGCALDPYCVASPDDRDADEGTVSFVENAPGLAYSGVSVDPVAHTLTLFGGITGCQGLDCGPWAGVATADNDLDAVRGRALASTNVTLQMSLLWPFPLEAVGAMNHHHPHADAEGWPAGASSGVHKVSAARLGIQWDDATRTLTSGSDFSAVLGGTLWQSVGPGTDYRATGDEVPGVCGVFDIEQLIPGDYVPIPTDTVFADANDARALAGDMVAYHYASGEGTFGAGILLDEGAYAMATVAIDDEHVFVTGGTGWEYASRAQYLIQMAGLPTEPGPLPPPGAVQAWRVAHDTSGPRRGASAVFDPLVNQGVVITGEDGTTRVELVTRAPRLFSRAVTTASSELEVVWESCDGGMAVDEGLWWVRHALALQPTGSVNEVALWMPPALFEQWRSGTPSSACPASPSDAPQIILTVNGTETTVTDLVEHTVHLDAAGAPLVTEAVMRLPQFVTSYDEVLLTLDAVLEPSTSATAPTQPTAGTAATTTLERTEVCPEQNVFSMLGLPLTLAGAAPPSPHVRVLHPAGTTAVVATPTPCTGLLLDPFPAAEQHAETCTVHEQAYFQDFLVAVHPSLERHDVVPDTDLHPYVDTCLSLAGLVHEYVVDTDDEGAPGLRADHRALLDAFSTGLTAPLGPWSMVFSRPPAGGAAVLGESVNKVSWVQRLTGDELTHFQSVAYHELAHRWAGIDTRFQGEALWLQEAIPELFTIMRYPASSDHAEALFGGMDWRLTTHAAGLPNLSDLEYPPAELLPKTITLYQTGPLALAQAAQLSGLGPEPFLQELANRFLDSHDAPYSAFDRAAWLSWLASDAMTADFHDDWVASGVSAAPLLAVTEARALDGGWFEIDIEQVQHRLAPPGDPAGRVPFHIVCDPDTSFTGCTATWGDDAMLRPASISAGETKTITVQSAGALRFALMGPHFLLPGDGGVPLYGVQDGVSQPLTPKNRRTHAHASPWLLLCAPDFPPVAGVGDLADTLCGSAVDIDDDGWRVPTGPPGREPPLVGGDCNDGDDSIHPTLDGDDWDDDTDNDCDGWPIVKVTP